MQKTRAVKQISQSRPTLEGAGVQLHRAFGSQAEAKLFDPFLLLDDFRADSPDKFLAGFPWHPHRGIETITYVLKGKVDHGDSLGNEGTIGDGDVQWMTAGNGIIHQEMPKGDGAGVMEGFQLWANLPSGEKMMAPRYRDITNELIPEVKLEDGVTVKIICGEAGGVSGPVEDVMIEPQYLDVTVPANVKFVHAVPRGHMAAAYVFEGAASFGEDGSASAGNRSLVLFDDGDQVAAEAGADGARFLLFSGSPLNEPIAWRGPIVMNTREEIETAFKQLQDNTFVKE